MWEDLRMAMATKRDLIEDVALIGGLVIAQFVYAANSVFISYLMSIGFNPLAIVIFSTFATFLTLSPFAVLFERRKWPKKFNFKLLIQLLLLSIGGVTLFQSLFLQGIKLTSPAMATAMPNLVPGLTFASAWACRLEKVKISCTYSRVKIVGTLMCVVGAITMSIMHSTTSPSEAILLTPSPDILFNKDKVIGCVYLLAAVIILSSSIVLQAATLGDFPAPMSLGAITCLFGVIMTTIVKFFQDQDLNFLWPVARFKFLFASSMLGGTVGGICVSFNGWVLNKRGPVVVSVFNPIGTVLSVVLSVITLGYTITLGSLAGMFLMFTGLYFVLWAKGKEVYHDSSSESESAFDAKKQLLIYRDM